MKFEIWIKEPFLRDVEFEHRAKELFKAFAASLTQYATPNPVATFLAREPPIEIGFPVITPGE